MEAETPGCFDWPEQYAGDTASVYEFQIEDEDGDPVDLTGGVVLMQLRAMKDEPVLFTATASISATQSNVILVGGYENPDLDGAFVYDLQVTLTDGSNKTYLAGMYPIIGQVSK